MAEEYIRVRHQPLEVFAASLLRGAGVGPEPARLVAGTLIEANLRGVDSHGVQLLNFYIDHMLAGCMDLETRGRVVSESAAVMVYDGENGIGQVVSDVCCDHAVRLAREHGVGVVTVRRSNHFGAAAHWGQKMAASGMLGIVMCNASPLVAPWQGRERRYGTNPICMALPGESSRVWLLDMATTTVAMGKIFKANFSGEKTIPYGWALDAQGVPTTDTQAAMSGMPMPLGGYKGYGLALMVEILVAVLSGGAMGTELGGVRIRTRPMNIGQMFLALDVARFLPVEEFDARIRKLVDMMKDTPRATGYDEVLVAGEPEWRAEAERLVHGVTLAKGVWEELSRVAARVGVEPPPVEPAGPPR